MDFLRIALVGLLLALTATVVAGGEAAPTTSPAQEICGTWVLQQVSSRDELDRLVPTTISPALKTPHVRGFCLRVPWKAIDRDFSLLEAGRHRPAARRGLQRSIHGRTAHAGARVRQSGAILPGDCSAPCFTWCCREGADAISFQWGSQCGL